MTISQGSGKVTILLLGVTSWLVGRLETIPFIGLWIGRVFTTRECYKVLTSTHSVWATGAARVQYKEGQYARAPRYLAKKGYHLLAFDSYFHARAFASKFGRSKIWKAKGTGRIDPIPPMLGIVDTQADLECCIRLRKKRRGFPYSGWPPGTVMFKEIMILRRME